MHLSKSLVFAGLRAVLLAATLLSLPRALAAEVWDGPAFTASPLEIAETAKRLVSARESDVVVFLDETRIVIDASHRLTETHRVVYRIGANGGDDWSVAEAIWQPWRQQRPVVRARVISPDGRANELDQQTLTETPMRAIGDNVFGDDRLLRAPLPAIVPGAVVEIQYVLRDTSPAFSGGIAGTRAFGRNVSVLRTILTIESPARLPFRHVVRLLPNVMPVTSTSGNTRTVSFESGQLAGIDAVKLLLSRPDHPTQPYIAFSTGESWKTIAEGFSAIVAESIRNSSLDSVVKETVKEGTARREVIEKLLRKTQTAVRYAAVQLGHAALVPTPPMETLKLGYGDCKDQSALLIAMLRVAGIEAYMALLSTGSGDDIEPDLPGFGLFNHAIVYVPGETPLWIDPTARFSRSAYIPVENQGRLALILKPDTTALARIPELPTHSLAKHEVSMTEDGRGRIAITMELHGTDELNARTVHSNTKAEELDKQLEQFAKVFHGAAKVGKIERSAADDLSTPFRIHFDIEESEFVKTGGGEAAYVIPVGVLLAETGLSTILQVDEKFTEDGVDLDEVTQKEWTYKVVPPPGFRIKDLPDKKSVAFGPARLEYEFSANANGEVLGTARFDSVKRVYSGAEAANARKALQDMTPDQSIVLITFDQIAKAYLDEGKTKESLAEYRKLSDLHPAEGLHHLQLAEALVGLTLGEAARAEARRAVEIEPRSARAHAVLAWTYEHDLIGRRWRSGFEFEKAKEAFLKAIELDPDDSGIRADYGLLLEHDLYGRRYTPAANMEEAVRQYGLIKDVAGTAAERNLPLALFIMGRFSEIKTSRTPVDIRLAAIAATDGSAAAVREAGRLDSSERPRRLSQAATLLMQGRLYEQAAALTRASGGTVPQAMLRTKRYDESANPGDPESVARRFFGQVLSRRRDDALRTLLTAEGKEELDRQPNMQLAFWQEGRVFGGTDTPTGYLHDSMVASLQATVEGDSTVGYRVAFAPGPGARAQSVVLVVEGGELKVLTAGSNEFALARGALRFLEKGDTDKAKRWLTWASDEVFITRVSYSVLHLDAFINVWSASSVKDAAELRYAAAALLSASPESSATVLPILSSGRTAARQPLRNGITLAYSLALSASGKYSESLDVARQLLKTDPRSRAIFLVADNMFRLDRLAELKTILESALKDPMDKREVTEVLAAVLLRQGDYAGAEARIKSLGPSSRSPLPDESLSWMTLYHEKITPEDIASLNGNLFGTPQALAAAYLDTGKIEEARALLPRWLSAGDNEPGPREWYILGRLYEEIGERSAALSTYEKVAKPSGPPAPQDMVYPLVERRLKLLGSSR